MDDKKKNSPKRNWQKIGLILSIGLNIVFAAMFLIFYLPSYEPLPPYREPDVFQLTSTALIQRATQIADGTFPTLVPIPTLSPTEEENLRQQYLHEIETELGFLHPVLEATVDELIASIVSRIDSLNRIQRAEIIPTLDKIILDTDRMTIEGADYVAVVVQDYIEASNGSRGYIFRVENGNVELLIEIPRAIEVNGFADRNGNGFPDISLSAINNTRDDTPISISSFLEIRPDHELVDLTAGIITYPVEFVDLNNDGIMEIRGQQQLFIPQGVEGGKFPYIPRWYFWNGETYEAYPAFIEEE